MLWLVSIDTLLMKQAADQVLHCFKKIDNEFVWLLPITNWPALVATKGLQWEIIYVCLYDWGEGQFRRSILLKRPNFAGAFPDFLSARNLPSISASAVIGNAPYVCFRHLVIRGLLNMHPILSGEDAGRYCFWRLDFSLQMLPQLWFVLQFKIPASMAACQASMLTSDIIRYNTSPHISCKANVTIHPSVALMVAFPRLTLFTTSWGVMQDIQEQQIFDVICTFRFSCLQMVPVVAVWVGIFPLAITRKLALAVTLYMTAIYALLFRVRVTRWDHFT